MLQQVLPALITLVVVFITGLILFRSKLPLGTLLAASAIIATIVAGMGLPLRHIVEGTFLYFNVILICITGMIFLQVLVESGAAAAISRSLVRRLYKAPILLLIAIMVLLLIPGMLTGVAVTSVLSIGVLVAPILIGLGIPPATSAAIIALGSILGMIAPPTNLLGMILAQGVNAPYEGFELPSLLLSLPLAIVAGLAMGIRYLKVPDREALLKALPETGDSKEGFMAWMPLLVVIGLMTLIRAFPGTIPDLGTPLVFMIGALLGLTTGGKVSLFTAARKALSGPMLTVVEILIGVGIFVQLCTLTGIRGLLVVSSLSLPNLAAYFAAAVTLLCGSGLLSPFGACSIFGVPFALFFLGKNQIIVITALSLMAACGQVIPPAAIVGRFAAQVTEVKGYTPILKKAGLWLFLFEAIGILTIAFSEPIASFIF